APGAKLLEAIFGIVLHALELHLQLLILILQLLKRAGELAQCALHAIDAYRQIAGVGLRYLMRISLTLLGRALLRGPLTAAEQIVEEAGTLLLRDSGAGQQQHGKRGKRRGADSQSWARHDTQPGSGQCSQHYGVLRRNCDWRSIAVNHVLFRSVKTPMPGAGPGMTVFKPKRPCVL